MDKHTLPKATKMLLLVDVINPLDFPGAQALAGPDPPSRPPEPFES
jgi:hypothetical protein